MASSSSSSPLRVGFVPEHFSTPIHFARKHYGLDAELIPFPSGTGHMITALRSGEIDVGIGLTEGWVAGLGKVENQGSEEGDGGDDGGYRLVGTYVETPLCWAVSTGAGRPEIQSLDSLKGGKVGVSRIGSGSYVMSYVLADQRNWLLPTAGAAGASESTGAPFSDFVALDTFERLRRAVNDGTADFFMWEHFTSKRYYDNGEIRKVGEIYTPWSSWKIVASTRLLPQQQRSAKNGSVDERVEDLLDRLNKGIKHFNENHDEAVGYISTELDYSEEDAREWLKTVRFPEATQGVDLEVVKTTVDVLKKSGVLKLSGGMKPEEMIAKRR